MCDNEWDTADAQVACRQLGYSVTGATTIARSSVPEGTGQIWLDNINCVGSENSVFDCNGNPVGIHNCDHSKDAGVMFCK